MTPGHYEAITSRAVPNIGTGRPIHTLVHSAEAAQGIGLVSSAGGIATSCPQTVTAMADRNNQKSRMEQSKRKKSECAIVTICVSCLPDEVENLKEKEKRGNSNENI